MPSFDSVATPDFAPRPDGKVLPERPDRLLASGRYHAVPILIGNQEDEGTLFSIFLQDKFKTSEDLVNYLSEVYFPNASIHQIRNLTNAYPSDSEGSPFRIGNGEVLYPNFRRLSALVGDFVFTLARRTFLELMVAANPNVPAWSYMSSYYHGSHTLGTYHASDLFQIFAGTPPSYATQSSRTYYFNFLYNLNPNIGKAGSAWWPLWKENKTLMWFKTQSRNGYLKDDFRSHAHTTIAKIGDSLRS